jgi:hypothetical protein
MGLSHRIDTSSTGPNPWPSTARTVRSPYMRRHRLPCHERRSRLQPPCEHKSNATAVVGKDQHAYNTDKTAIPGTLRHDCHEAHASAVTSNDADELG